jgi:hypothetical protein
MHLKETQLTTTTFATHSQNIGPSDAFIIIITAANQ